MGVHACAAVCFVRFVVLPLAGAVIVVSSVKAGLYAPPDPVFAFLLMLQVGRGGASGGTGGGAGEGGDSLAGKCVRGGVTPSPRRLMPACPHALSACPPLPLLPAQYCVPSANQVQNMASMWGNHEREVGALIFWEYVVALVCIPAWMVCFVW